MATPTISMTSAFCGLCWLQFPHDHAMHQAAIEAARTRQQAFARIYQERTRLLQRWQPLIAAMSNHALDQFGSWLIDERADLAWSNDDTAIWLNGQLQCLVGDVQDRRAIQSEAARSAA